MLYFKGNYIQERGWNNAEKEGAPLYLQIYKELQKRIENGVYKENELLPSEASLQAEFNVSRITIRRSLQDLELAGFIKVQKGKGAMVLANRKYTDLVGVSSFSQDAMKSGNGLLLLSWNLKKWKLPESYVITYSFRRALIFTAWNVCAWKMEESSGWMNSLYRGKPVLNYTQMYWMKNINLCLIWRTGSPYRACSRIHRGGNAIYGIAERALYEWRRAVI